MEEGNLLGSKGRFWKIAVRLKAKPKVQAQQCSPRDPAGARQPPGNTRTGFAGDEGCGEGFPGPILLFEVACGSTATTSKQ